MAELLEFEPFREWLMKHKDKVVGYSCSEQQNPLANYLTEKMGEHYWADRLMYQALAFDGENISLPAWASSFACDLDGYCGYQIEAVFGWLALEMLSPVSSDESGYDDDLIAWPFHTPGYDDGLLE
jgi:hypothetical protein